MSLDVLAVKALALDLDGTVLRPDNTLSGRTIKALRACMDRGIEVILCTGRAVEGAEKYRAAIGAEGPMVYFNGAEVVDMPAGTVLDASLLALDVADFCVDLARNMGVHYQVYFPATAGSREILMVEKFTPEAEMYQKHTGIQPVTGDQKKFIAESGTPGCIKSMFIAEPAVQDKIRPLLEERFGSSIYIARTYPTFLEVMAAGVSKGAGLRAAMKKRGLDSSGILALGDEENDLPMFEAAGFSLAPANAKEKVRKAADMVIGSNADDGAAEYLETLFHLGG
jgi:Cof subfamily protein (haloacid dehalogenase superfamily)